MKKILITTVSLFSISLILSYSSFASNILTNKPVNIDFSVADPSLPSVANVSELTWYGLEYKNTTSNSGLNYVTVGDTAVIDGAFAITSMLDPDGRFITPPGLNSTGENGWEFTVTYQSLSDFVWGADVEKYDFITSQQVGFLTFYVSTDMTKRASTRTGLGYDDGTIVAQFAVYNPLPEPGTSTSGGVMRIVTPYNGSRDLLMTKQYELTGFLTSSNDPDEDITAIRTGSDQNADTERDGPGNSDLGTMWEPAPEINWPFAYFTENDGSLQFGTVPVPPDGSCRMTGGGNDENGFIILGTPASSEDGRYTYGGQVGAPTGEQPQPYGEWTHHQFKGFGDKFVFRSGTASSSEESKILNIFCQDPCNCVNARPAPFKQISWDGIGEFRNISDAGIAQLEHSEPPAPKNPNKPVKSQPLTEPICEGGIVPGKDGSKHYYKVHVNDIGEPGSGGLISKGNGKKSTRSECDLDLAQGFPETPYSITEDQCNNCPDTYQIEIHCTTDPDSEVIYSVGAFVEGGNLQIHPPVGEHMTPGMCPK